MKNIYKIAKFVEKHGTNGIFIHAIPNNKYWVVAEKHKEDKWMLTLCDPHGTTSYKLGWINYEDYKKFRNEMLHKEIYHRLSRIQIAEEMKNNIRNFALRRKTYENFTKNKICSNPKHKAVKKRNK